LTELQLRMPLTVAPAIARGTTRAAVSLLIIGTSH
jgi:hypothetical protein